MPGPVHAEAEGTVPAPPAEVHAFLTDYRRRPEILPVNYQDYRVVEGGVGAGTVVAYRFKAGPRERDYRVRAETPDGASLVERDETSTLVTTWRVKPADAGSRVRIETEWQGASGMGGFFERTFAPRALSRVYADMLARLATAVSGRPAAI
ncbi:MAG TPA: SRPBCC family protein [Candidatus Dormibacteraeota bacterium]|jgi:carbon monoxide dehydrogenase subunit G